MEKIGDEVRDISDEIPFDIPESWEWCRLGDYVQKVTDYVASGSFASLRENVKIYKEPNYAILVKTKDFQKNFTEDLTYTDKHGYEFLENSRLFGGELIMPNIGASIGKVFKVPNLNAKMTLAPNSVLIRFISDEYLKWFSNFFLSPLGFALLKNISSSTAQAKFSKTEFKNILFPVPPLAEQHRIVAKIEELLPYIENYTEVETKHNTLNTTFPAQLKKSILQQAVQGKLVPQNPDDEPASVLLERIRAEKQELIKADKIKKDKNESIIFRRDNSHYEMVSGVERCIDDEIPFEVPENWDFTRLFTICIKDVKRGKSPKYGKNNNVLVFAQKCNTKSGDIKLDLAQGLDNDAFNKYPSDEIMCDNDIIVNSTGTGTLGRIGFYTKSDNPTNAVVVPDSHVTVVRITNSVDSKFIYHCLKYYQPILEEQGEGSTNQKELKPYTISNLIIPLPPLSEQYRIVEKIEELIKVCEKL